MATTTHTPSSPHTINVYGAHKGQDHTYTTNSAREAYAIRDFWIAEGYTAIVTGLYSR